MYKFMPKIRKLLFGIKVTDNSEKDKDTKSESNFRTCIYENIK